MSKKEMKNCSRCKRLLDLDKFGTNGSSGHCSSCKSCTYISGILNKKCTSCGDKIKERKNGNLRVRCSDLKWFCCSDCRYEYRQHINADKTMVKVNHIV